MRHRQWTGSERGRDEEKCERNDKEIEEEIKEGNKKHENILKSPPKKSINTENDMNIYENFSFLLRLACSDSYHPDG